MVVQHIYQKVRCTYQLLPSDIHEIAFRETSTQAVDEWAEYMAKILTNAPSEKTVRILIKSSPSGTQPVAHLFLRMRQLAIEHPKRPPTRIAVVHGADYLVSLVKSMFNTIRKKTDLVRFYPFDQYEEAVNWLLQD